MSAAPGMSRRSAMPADFCVSLWYASIVSNTCAGRPRSVMMTGPLLAARFAPLASWLNSRLETVVTGMIVIVILIGRGVV